MFIKFTIRDFRNVRTVFGEVDELSASEKATLDKAIQIIDLMKISAVESYLAPEKEKEKSNEPNKSDNN